ncbi:hypothetical protein [Rhodopseudomonas sp. RCAM05734]
MKRERMRAFDLPGADRADLGRAGLLIGLLLLAGIVANVLAAASYAGI